MTLNYLKLLVKEDFPKFTWVTINIYINMIVF